MKSLGKILKTEFGRRLKAARIAAGFSPQDFAGALEVEPSTVYRWESGSLPRDEQVPGILQLLHVTLDQLLGDPVPVPPTISELTQTIRRQERRIRELESMVKKFESPADGHSKAWRAAETFKHSRIPAESRELLEQIDPANRDAWELINTAALTVGKAKQLVKPRG